MVDAIGCIWEENQIGRRSLWATTTCATWIIWKCPKGYCHCQVIWRSYIWHNVTKTIDSLHLWNHKDLRCQQYDPKNVLEPGMNTMSCEQTFAWMSRYKKILSAMPKIHHHFYLHRMVQRRNKYISRCYSLGRRPVQPRVRYAEKWGTDHTMHTFITFTNLNNQITNLYMFITTLMNLNIQNYNMKL